MLGQLLAMSTGLKIFLMILFTLALLPAIYFLFLGIRKDHRKFINARNKLKDIKPEELEELIKKKIESDDAVRFALIFVEFISAKEFEETYGEDYYAGALGMMRERVTSVLPKNSKVCLYKYDTYAFMLENDIPMDQLKEYAALCLTKAHMHVPCGRGKRTQEPDISVGAARFETDEENMTMEDLMRNTEVALAASRRAGINHLAVFVPELLESNADYRYYREIKDAINAGEFALYFQPIFNLFEGDTIAYEATIHWDHGDFGTLSPEKFLHVIEKSGDINWVGLWAYEQLLIEYRKYLKLHPHSRIAFSMNLTNRQITDPKICDELNRITKKYNIDPSYICFEVGEMAVLERIPVVAENLEKLVQCGFMTAVDDFGLETNGVTKLGEQRMFDWVKLDKSFTEKVKQGDPDIKNMQQLLESSRANSVFVMAQGIDDGMTEEFIKRIGIFCGQGYHLGKSEPFERYLHQAEVVTKKAD